MSMSLVVVVVMRIHVFHSSDLVSHQVDSLINVMSRIMMSHSVSVSVVVSAVVMVVHGMMVVTVSVSVVIMDNSDMAVVMMVLMVVDNSNMAVVMMVVVVMIIMDNSNMAVVMMVVVVVVVMMVVVIMMVMDNSNRDVPFNDSDFRDMFVNDVVNHRMTPEHFFHEFLLLTHVSILLGHMGVFVFHVVLLVGHMGILLGHVDILIVHVSLFVSKVSERLLEGFFDLDVFTSLVVCEVLHVSSMVGLLVFVVGHHGLGIFMFGFESVGLGVENVNVGDESVLLGIVVSVVGSVRVKVSVVSVDLSTVGHDQMFVLVELSAVVTLGGDDLVEFHSIVSNAGVGVIQLVAHFDVLGAVMVVLVHDMVLFVFHVVEHVVVVDQFLLERLMLGLSLDVVGFVFHVSKSIFFLHLDVVVDEITMLGQDSILSLVGFGVFFE